MATNRELNLLLTLKDQASGQLKGFSGKLQSLQPQFKKMSVAGTLAFGAIAGVVGKAVATFGKFEQAEVAFTSMLGSAEQAKDMIEELSEFSAKTPFQFEDIVQATRTLVAFGIEGEDAKNKIKFLGDISAGAQIPLGELAQIFGKVQTKGKAMTEEILQMSERGIPIIDELAKQFDVGKEAIFEMAAAGEISADVVEDALKGMTEEGAIFANQMEKQSQTIFGLFSTLKDNVTLAMAEIGAVFETDVKSMVEWLTKVIGKVKEWVKENPQLTKVIIIATAALIGLVAIVGTLGLILPSIIAGFFFLVSPIGLVVLAVMALIAVGVFMWVKWDEIKGGILLIWETLKIKAQEIWNFVANFFKNLWEGVKNFFIGVWDAMLDKVKSWADAVLEIIQPIIDKINQIAAGLGSFGGKIKSGIGAVGDFIGVNDAIITPRGDVIKTDPADFLIATKKPGELGGGGGITININGGFFGSDAGEELGDMIIKQLMLRNKLT